MEVRGNRRCQSCGSEWSYYETGTVACPSCGSLESVGTDAERRQHTDTPATLNLATFADRIAGEPLERYGADLRSTLRSYTQKRGFINGGELRALDDRYLAARELIHLTDMLQRRQSPTTDERLYLLAVFNSLSSTPASADGSIADGSTTDGTVADGTVADAATSPTDEWPSHEDVPPSLRAARGLAVTEGIEAYRRDLRTWLTEHPDPEATRTLGRLREQCKRAEALGGDVDPEHAGELLTSARGIGRSLREDDHEALVSARDRLGRL